MFVEGTSRGPRFERVSPTHQSLKRQEFCLQDEIDYTKRLAYEDPTAQAKDLLTEEVERRRNRLREIKRRIEVRVPDDPTDTSRQVLKDLNFLNLEKEDLKVGFFLERETHPRTRSQPLTVYVYVGTQCVVARGSSA